MECQQDAAAGHRWPIYLPHELMGPAYVPLGRRKQIKNPYPVERPESAFTPFRISSCWMPLPDRVCWSLTAVLSAFGERCTLLEGPKQPRGAEGGGGPGGRHLRAAMASARADAICAPRSPSRGRPPWRKLRGRVAFPPPASGVAVEAIGPKVSRSAWSHNEGGRSFAKFNPTALNSAASYASSNRHLGRRMEMCPWKRVNHGIRAGRPAA